MTLLHLDVETRSRIDLMKSTVYRYVEDDQFRILMCAWAIDDGPVQVAIGHNEIKNIPGLWDPHVTKVAHNANFERICFSKLCNMPLGKYLSPAEWLDTMVLAAEAGYPMKLEMLAPAVGAELKDSAGKRLINLFSKPNRKGGFNNAQTHPEEWAQFVEYCRQDVITMRDIYHRLPDWPTPEERIAWMTDQYINDRGIPVDVDMAKSAILAGDDNAVFHELEFMHLTGVDNPNSGPQVLKWLRGQGVKVANLQAETVTDLLAGELPNDTVRRALELRQELALVASKKYQAALDRINTDGRLRGGFQFFGAHTGRFAGRGVQLQNLPSATIKCYCPPCSDPEQKDIEGHVDAAIAEVVEELLDGAGVTAHQLKALVRAAFVGPFTVVDYSAIEARVVAWLAGEQWALDAFAKGRDIYVETAERMGGLTRKQGKVAVLALGFQGGVKSLQIMGAEDSEEKLASMVKQWRQTNQNIVQFWYDLDYAFKAGEGEVGRVRVESKGNDRYIYLPSGRPIVYHDVRMRWGVVQLKDGSTKKVKKISYKDPKKPGRIDTYGGRLTENVTQAVARDIIMEAMVRLQAEGVPVVGHVHDECLILGEYSVEEVTEIMVENPKWAKGLPINAEGFTCPRYRKG